MEDGIGEAAGVRLSRLYGRYHQQLLRVLGIRLGRQRELAEDLVGEVWVQAVAALAVTSVRASEEWRWLAGIAGRVLVAHYQEDTRRPVSLEVAAECWLPVARSAEDVALERLAVAELVELIELIEQLIEDQELDAGGDFGGNTGLGVAA